MTKPMEYRKLVKLLRAAGFTPEQGKGDHEKWSAPGFAKHVIVTQTREVSPGLTGKALKTIDEKKQQDKEADQ